MFKKMKTILLICCVALISVSNATTLVHLTFDESIGDEPVAIDSSGYGHDGVLATTSSTTPFVYDANSVVSGVYDNGLSMTTVAKNYVTLNWDDPTSLPGLTAGSAGTYFTVSFWTKTSSWGAGQNMIQLSVNGFRMTIGIASYELRAMVYDLPASDGYSSMISVSGISSSAWHHVAAVVQDGAVLLYLDGVASTSWSTSGYVCDFNKGILLGRRVRSGASSALYTGAFDDFAIFDEAFTATQVADLYNSTTPVENSSLPGNPDPANGTIDMPLSYTLGWTPISEGTITSQTVTVATDVYLQDVVASIPAVGNTAEVSELTDGVIYYWRVETTGSVDGVPFTRMGPVWTFETASLVCALTQADGNLNDDCIIDQYDLAIMASNWLRSEYQ